LILSILAVLVNPVGLNQLTYPFSTMLLGSQRIGLQYSSEWQPAPMDDVRVWALFAVAGLGITIPLLRRTELQLQEFVLLGIAFVLSVPHERMLFVFGILVMPSICRLLATAWGKYEPGRDSALISLLMILLATVPIVLGFPSSRSLVEQVHKANPVEAVKFIQRSRLSGRMLNEYVYGGYLIWAVPERKVFVDGRSDVYEWTGVLGDYMNWVNLKANPTYLLDKYQIDFCLLSRQEPVVQVLQIVPGWKTVYSDESSIVFVRSVPRQGANLLH
jgi:hypothetical protein